MTAPDSALVDAVAEALWTDYADRRRMVSPTAPWPELITDWKDEERRRARIAIRVCHVEELTAALRDLLADTQHHGHNCGDTPDNCPVLAARSLLAKLPTD